MFVDNTELKKAYFAFDEKHGREGINVTLRGVKGTLYPDGAFLPYHEYYFLPGEEPPREEWKRKQLILKYYDTRAANAVNKFNKLKAELELQARNAEEFAGRAYAPMAPTPVQIAELEKIQVIAKERMDKLNEVREQLGDVRSPEERGREYMVSKQRTSAQKASEAIHAIKL